MELMSQHVAEGVSEQIYSLAPEDLEKDFVLCQDLSVSLFYWFIPGRHAVLSVNIRVSNRDFLWAEVTTARSETLSPNNTNAFIIPLNLSL